MVTHGARLSRGHWGWGDTAETELGLQPPPGPDAPRGSAAALRMGLGGDGHRGALAPCRLVSAAALSPKGHREDQAHAAAGARSEGQRRPQRCLPLVPICRFSFLG